ncbi:MAG: hypothetical protein U1F06_02060 [Steroidobacteraceae bacterium]
MQLEAVVAQRRLQRLQPVRISPLWRATTSSRAESRPARLPPRLATQQAESAAASDSSMLLESRASSTRPMLTPTLKMRSFHTKR